MGWNSAQAALEQIKREEAQRTITVRISAKREGVGAPDNTVEDSQLWEKPEALGLKHCKRLTAKPETTRSYCTTTGKWITRLEIWTVPAGFTGLWTETLRITPLARQ